MIYSAPIVEWIHGPSRGKRAILAAYESLTDRQRAALADDVGRAFREAHGADRVVAYRYRSVAGDDWGGASLSTVEPAWLAPDKYQAVEVGPEQVLAHWNQADLPLGGKAFGHERELILKPDARVTPLRPRASW